MSTQTDITIQHGLALIKLGSGPAPSLTTALLHRLDMALSQVEDDAEVFGVAILGSSGGFPTGMTTPSTGGDDTDGLLPSLCRRIEIFAKPVIAVLSGTVVGGGAELALACHYRIARHNARIGFPNVRLGVVPNAGATQRLPRLVGAPVTLELLLAGHLIPLGSDKLAPLVDALFDDSPEDAALRFAQSPDNSPLALRPTADNRTGFSDAPAFHTAIVAARNRVKQAPEEAPKHILSAVEASVLLPIEAGLAFEQAAHEDCAATDQARALSHLFHAEQAASVNTRRTDLPPLKSIAVLGGGPLAVQITLTALAADLDVTWVVKDSAQRDHGVAQVKEQLQDAVLNGAMSADKAARCQSALTAGDGPEMAQDVDMALRAARGQRGVAVPPNIPIAHCLSGSDAHLAMRFAPPAAATRLIEVILGPQATERDRMVSLALAKRMAKLAIVEQKTDRSLFDRLTHALLRAADSLVDLGQSPFRIDAALRDWGMATPPFELADQIGFDVVSRLDRGAGATNWAETLIRYGREGRHAGRGFYRYNGEDVALADPEVIRLLDIDRDPQPDLPNATLVRLLIGAAANEGARALQSGVVPRASDIDVVSVFSNLVPRWRGGILHAVGAEGLLQTTRAMQSLDHSDAVFWTPEPIFAELVKYGRSFDDL